MEDMNKVECDDTMYSNNNISNTQEQAKEILMIAEEVYYCLELDL